MLVSKEKGGTLMAKNKSDKKQPKPKSGSSKGNGKKK